MRIKTRKHSEFFIIFLMLLAVIIVSCDSPPPPSKDQKFPPACPIQSAGCYKTGDVKAGFGELSPKDFGVYYLPEDKCKRSGECDCKGVSDTVAKETNPDDSSGACSCIAGTDWNAKAKCCGDDTEDCGRISSGVLCSIDANGESSQWLPSASSVGDIRYAGCSRVEYLSDGNTWFKCEGTFWKKTVGNSEYVCIGRGRESVVECCGDGSCKSRVDGKRLSTGQSVNPEKFENEPASTFKLGDSASNYECKVIKKTGCTDITNCGGESFFDFQCTLRFENATKKIAIDCEKEVCAKITGSVAGTSSNPSGTCEPIITEGAKPCSLGPTGSESPINQPSASSDSSCYCPSNKRKEEFETACEASRCSKAWRCIDSSEYPLKCSNTQSCPGGYKCSSSNTPTGNVIQNPSNQVTGQAVSTGDTKTYYCRSDRKFATDLDVPTSQAKDRTLIGKNAATCEKAGFKWTGTKCCSEDDDANEYYSDPKGTGGCWDKKPVESISFVEGTDNSIVNFNGEFHGCAIDKTTFNKNNDELLALVDKHTNGPLITNHDYCFNDPEKNYFCSYTEKWLQTDGTEKAHVSFAPIKNPRQIADCCATKECWDGFSCVENMKANPSAQPIGNNSRCIDGEWMQAELKSTADESAFGYCPKKTQCLANALGKTEASQCIESGQYIDDNYCENGTWSTRTKLLALKLLKRKSGDFALFCDDRENALNNLQYLTDSNEAVANIIASLKTNNFCVLKISNKITAATSINKNLEDLPKDSLNIFGVTSCDDALIDDGQYHSCDAASKVWYNKRLKSFIYSSTPLTITSEQEPLSSFEEFISNPIKNIIEAIKRLVTSPPVDESYLKGVKKFDKLYMVQQGSTTIRGIIEGTKSKNIIIEYGGFNTDICRFIDQYSQAKKDVSSGISCKKEGNNFYVLVQGSQFTNINPETIWLDLTSKLRLK